jgi:hypothetical protein
MRAPSKNELEAYFQGPKLLLNFFGRSNVLLASSRSWPDVKLAIAPIAHVILWLSEEREEIEQHVPWSPSY